MSVTWRKSKSLGHGTRVTATTHGVGVSKAAGPFSVSSRGNFSVRLPGGFSYRKHGGAGAGAAAAVFGVMLLVWLVKVAAVLVWSFCVLAVRFTVWASVATWRASVAVASPLLRRGRDAAGHGLPTQRLPAESSTSAESSQQTH